MDKRNKILFTAVGILFLFFLLLGYLRRNDIVEVNTTFKIQNEGSKIRIFDVRSKNHSGLLKRLEKEYAKVRDIDQVFTRFTYTMREERITKYIFQIGENVLVGEGYHGAFRVALTYHDQSLFQIITLQNQLLRVVNSSSKNYDKIILYGDVDKVTKLASQLPSLSITNCEKLVKDEKNLVVIYLKDHEIVKSMGEDTSTNQIKSK